MPSAMPFFAGREGGWSMPFFTAAAMPVMGFLSRREETITQGRFPHAAHAFTA